MSSLLFIPDNSFKNFTSHLSTDSYPRENILCCSYNMMKPAGKRQEQALEEKVRYPFKSTDKKIMCNLSMPIADVFIFIFSLELAFNKSPAVFICLYALDLDAISKSEGQ